MRRENNTTGVKEKVDIQCPLCGNIFSEGQKKACDICPLSYSKCHFEKCPNCGYDIPQGSAIWTFFENISLKLGRVKKNDGK